VLNGTLADRPRAIQDHSAYPDNPGANRRNPALTSLNINCVFWALRERGVFQWNKDRITLKVEKWRSLATALDAARCSYANSHLPVSKSGISPPEEAKPAFGCLFPIFV